MQKLLIYLGIVSQTILRVENKPPALASKLPGVDCTPVDANVCEAGSPLHSVSTKTNNNVKLIPYVKVASYGLACHQFQRISSSFIDSSMLNFHTSM